MVVYWIVMTAIPNPAGVRGDLTPDGNWGAYIDRAVFGSHLWVSSKTWDPEGLLSTVPAVATTLLGIVAGLWLGSNASASRKALWLAVAGIAGLALGELWNTVFPINKNLWTSSYVAFTAGFAALLLAISYWAIDVKGWRGWTKPFVVLGANAITLFAASALLVKTMVLIKVHAADGSSRAAVAFSLRDVLCPAGLAEECVASVRHRQPRTPLGASCLDVSTTDLPARLNERLFSPPARHSRGPPPSHHSLLSAPTAPPSVATGIRYKRHGHVDPGCYNPGFDVPHSRHQ